MAVISRIFAFWKGICVVHLGFPSPGLVELWCLVSYSVDVLHPGSLVQALSVCSDIKIGCCGCVSHESGGYLEEGGGLSSGEELALQ